MCYPQRTTCAGKGEGGGNLLSMIKREWDSSAIGCAPRLLPWYSSHVTALCRLAFLCCEGGGMHSLLEVADNLRKHTYVGSHTGEHVSTVFG